MLSQFYCLFLLLLHFFVGVTLSEEGECRRLNRADIEGRLSTKTPYRAIANYDETPPKYAGCHPTRIWSIIRHGTRNPSESVILQAQNRLSEIKKRILDQTTPPICTAELKKLRQWHWMHLNATEDEKLLVAEGEDELIELAERMQRRFPDLLPELYNPEWYYFKYTATQRTLKSAESFATGLFGRHRIHTVRYPPPLHEDPVLRVSSPLVFPLNVTKNNF